MMEIVFGESACGSLKIAQSYGKGPYRGGAVGVFLRKPDGSAPTQAELEQARRQAEEEARRAWESAEPLGGSAADVFGIDLNLSEGDVSGDVLGTARRAQMLQKLEQLGNAHAAQVLPMRMDAARAALDAARAVLASDGRIRIWYSEHHPDEFCGFCWLMAQLRDVRSGEVRAVCLPRQVEDENKITRYGSWGEVRLEEWHRLVCYERTLSPLIRRVCAAMWQQLAQENTPLRAVVNGGLMSVPADFYDGFIRREIAAQGEKFHEARAIGNVLGRYELGIGDGLIALRIEEMIRRGELEAVTQPEPGDIIYRRWLQKTGKFSENT